MFTEIFKKRGVGKGKSRERGLSAAPASAVKQAVEQADSTFHLDITIDEAMLALDSELFSLGRLEVAQAAKERGWAALRRELERRPVRATAPTLLKGTGAKAPVHTGAPRPVLAGHSRGWRVALGSAVAAVAVLAALLGTYGAGLLTAGNGGTSTTLVAAGSTDITQPDTSVSTGESTPSTQVPETTGPTVGTSTTTGTTSVSSSTTQATGGSTVTSGPTTTKPTQTTTNEQQMAAAQREKTAKAAAFDLADMVINGDMSGARSLVSGGAQADLVQMASSLEEPYSYQYIGSKSLGSNLVRVTLEFSDRVYDEKQGKVVETRKRFAITVQVDGDGATITAISAGS